MADRANLIPEADKCPITMKIKILSPRRAWMKRGGAFFGQVFTRPMPRPLSPPCWWPKKARRPAAAPPSGAKEETTDQGAADKKLIATGNT